MSDENVEPEGVEPEVVEETPAEPEAVEETPAVPAESEPEAEVVVDPAVIKKAPILDRSYGIDQIGW